MSPQWRLFPAGRLTGGIVALVTAVLLVVLTGWVRLGPTLPLYPSTTPKPALVLLTAQGEPFARRGVCQEAPVEVARLPAHVVAPFLAIEDRRFYAHGGFDVRGVTRATLANLFAGGVEQGGSTITQQLAKIAFVGADRSFLRKGKEAIVALRLEQQYSKDEILSAYLSRAYFGDGAYGLGAAARQYFDKDPGDLDIGEAAMLSGLVNAPSRLTPTRHLEDAQRRARIVLAAMVDARLLGQEDADRIPDARPVAGRPSMQGGDYFADWVQVQARNAAGTGYGRVAVRTTLDADLQRSAEAAVATALAREGRKSGVRQAALVAMRTDCSIVAMVGGSDYRQSKYNRAVQAERQPGSAFKLFVYLAATRAGADGDTVISDRPLKVAGWSPKNFGNRYGGQLTLTRAFAQSSNVAAVRLSERVGRDEVIRAAQDLGLKGSIKPLPSIALGTSPTTLNDITAAYAGVAAGAYPIVPTGLLGTAMPAQSSLSPQEREPLLAMLNAAVESGTGSAARLPLPAFGKTGTNQDNRNAWFIGFAGDLIVGIWVGNDDETPMKGVTGGGLPARIWRAFMGDALAGPIAADAERRAAEAVEQQEQRWHEERGPWWDEPVEDMQLAPWAT